MRLSIVFPYWKSCWLFYLQLLMAPLTFLSEPIKYLTFYIRKIVIISFVRLVCLFYFLFIYWNLLQIFVSKGLYNLI